jgi:hypothetical protein
VRGVEAAYRRWGFDLNWGEGKTELMLIFTGRGSKNAEEAVRAPDGRGREIIFERGDSTSQSVRIVNAYKHVGSIVQASGSTASNTEAHARAARGAHGRLAKQLRSRAYWPGTRISLLRSLVHSRLLHDMEAMPGLPRAQLRKLQAVHVDTTRRAMRRAAPSTEEWHRGSDEQVLREAGVTTCWSQVRARRLMLAWALAREPQDQLAALLEPTSTAPSGWSTALLGDLRELHACAKELQWMSLGDPYDCPGEWAGLIESTPKATWRRWTRNVLRYVPEVRAAIPYEVDTTVGDIGGAGDQEGQAPGDEPQPDLKILGTIMDFVCPLCPPVAARVFATAGGLATHKWRAHGCIKSARFRLGPQLQCPVCGCTPASRGKLLVHAMRSACAPHVEELPVLPIAVLRECDPAAADILECG